MKAAGALLCALAITGSQSQNVSVGFNSCAYKNPNSWSGNGLANGFNFFTGPDPTHGAVKYLNRDEATKKGLWKVNGNQVHMGVDKDNKTGNGGRPSVRIESKQGFGNGLILIDLAHMPGQACGIWPAIWTKGPGNWPDGGEIDVVEYINKNEQNLLSLHTKPDCKVNRAGNTMSGTISGTDCAVKTGGTVGCGVKQNGGAGIGNAFNRGGGGVYAIERTNDHIKIWALPKSNGAAKSNSPDPCKDFGQPVAFFPIGKDCTKDHFGPQTLIINTVFCGDWADGQSNFKNAGCPGKCADYVANNPKAFAEAYWTINSIKFFPGK